MSPKGNQHEVLKTALLRRWYSVAPDHLDLTPETTFRLSEDTYLEPDVVIYPRASGIRGLTAATALLVVEIANSSLRYDMGRKAALYASFGIRELWVIDAVKLTARLFRDPGAEVYREYRDAVASDRLVPSFAPQEFALQARRTGSRLTSRLSPLEAALASHDLAFPAPARQAGLEVVPAYAHAAARAALALGAITSADREPIRAGFRRRRLSRRGQRHEPSDETCAEPKSRHVSPSAHACFFSFTTLCRVWSAVSKKRRTAARRLADALLVLDQRKAHVVVAVLAEADAGRDGDVGLLDQELREFERAEIAEALRHRASRRTSTRSAFRSASRPRRSFRS